MYINGRELERSHLPKRGQEPDALAAAYPEEVFVTDDGEVLTIQGTYVKGKQLSPRLNAESVRRMGLRVRSLRDVPIPRDLLRRGVNVLALEIVRAPYHSVLAGLGPSGPFPVHLVWDTCALNTVQLTAAGAAGLVPEGVRTEGLQVWNSDLHAGDFTVDFGSRSEPLRPIRLVGARNGTYSGKVVLGSAEPIRNLHASATDLEGPAGTIPASAVRVRYGVRWGRQYTRADVRTDSVSRYNSAASLLGCIARTAPAEYPIVKEPFRAQPGVVRVWGAVAPLWVTVRVPRGAAPGAYRGHVVAHVQDEDPISVPVQLEVIDWVLPDPQDYRIWVGLIQSPDTLMVEYGLERWSDRHFAMIAQSMDYLREVGCRVLYVPLIAHTNLGNEESMVRWIEKGDGKFEHDLSIFDRYVDTAEQHVGKPKIIVFNVWDLYLMPNGDSMSDAEARQSSKRVRHTRMALNLNQHQGTYGLGPLVTVVDPTTGKTENKHLPCYTEPVSKTLWGPLLRELKQRLERRGLAGTMMLGMHTDAWASKQELEFFKDIDPDIPWVVHSHDGFSGKLMHGVARVGYQARVWSTKFADHVKTHGRTYGADRLYGWKEKELIVTFERNTGLDAHPSTRWRHFGETNIAGGQRGVGRIGADFWPCVKDKRGRRRGTVAARYPESHWRNLNLSSSLLAPAPDGPGTTNRFEAFREGIQECEARIFIEDALTDPAKKVLLTTDLVEKCQKELDERLTVMWRSLSNLQMNGPGWCNAVAWRWTPGMAGHTWFISSGWQERSAKLYTLAGGVAGQIGQTKR